MKNITIPTKKQAIPLGACSSEGTTHFPTMLNKTGGFSEDITEKLTAFAKSLYPTKADYIKRLNEIFTED